MGGHSPPLIKFPQPKAETKNLPPAYVVAKENFVPLLKQNNFLKICPIPRNGLLPEGGGNFRPRGGIFPGALHIQPRNGYPPEAGVNFRPRGGIFPGAIHMSKFSHLAKCVYVCLSEIQMCKTSQIKDCLKLFLPNEENCKEHLH